MKMIYGTAQDPRAVVVEYAPEEVRIVDHGAESEVLFHYTVGDRIKNALAAAGVTWDDIISSDFEMTEEEDAAIFAPMAFTSIKVPVRKARAPRRKILRRNGW